MSTMDLRGQTRVLDGNRAGAYGVLLSRPDVIASYPITPQTPLLETLYKFEAEGLLEAEMVEPEGENSAMGVLLGACAAGGRTFTASSSQGLSFMNDAYLLAAGNRFPIVMAIGMREQVSPHGVVAGQQDAVLVKDHGWIQIYMESCQEILDSMVMAYRLAEDSDVLLPVNVCYEGFFLSHHSQRVEIPRQEEVDKFLAPLKSMERLKWTLDDPMVFSSYTVPAELFTEYRYKACAAHQRAKGKFDEIDREFGQQFGRSYGGQIEEYRTEDAEVVIVSMGCSTGTAKVVVDKKREEGLKVGSDQNTDVPSQSERTADQSPQWEKSYRSDRPERLLCLELRSQLRGAENPSERSGHAGPPAARFHSRFGRRRYYGSSCGTRH